MYFTEFLDNNGTAALLFGNVRLALSTNGMAHGKVDMTLCYLR